MTAREILDAMGKNPAKYDFREKINGEELRALDPDTPLARHVSYQTTKMKGEADSCPLFQGIAVELLTKKRECLFECAWVYGDVMNSISTTLNCLFFLKQEYLGIKLTGRQQMSDKRICTAYKSCQNKRIKMEEIIEKKGANDFLQVAYTIGNLIPCPVGCNCYGTMKDYWDLKLQCIYNWYLHEQKQESIKTLFGRRRKAETCVDQYVAWLSAFGIGQKGWDNYVTKNFMQPFVKGGDVPFTYETDEEVKQSKREKKFGPPKELWKGHFSGLIMPVESQIEEFFTNAAKAIKRRSELMVDELKKLSGKGK